MLCCAPCTDPSRVCPSIQILAGYAAYGVHVTHCSGYVEAALGYRTVSRKHSAATVLCVAPIAPPRLCKVPCCCPKTATVCFSNITASTACPAQGDSVQLPFVPQVANPAALLQHHSGIRAFARTPLADLVTASQDNTTTALSLSVRNM